jgi:DNA-directed RNA polymerases I and III subunit RPAC1
MTSKTKFNLDAPSYAASGSYDIGNTDTPSGPISLRIIEQNGTESIQFELLGVSSSVANALRRIMISEVPTMAIEDVFISLNTSVMQDEVLAHRLGLVPIAAPALAMEYLDVAGVPTDHNTLVFTLAAKCDKSDPKTVNVGEQGLRRKVLSSDLVWARKTSEESAGSVGALDQHIAPVSENILLNVLADGQELSVECHAVKGIGRTHAKWSPVATASYRLMPDVQVTTDIHDAEAVKKSCPMDVFDIEDVGGRKQGGQRAVAARPMQCTMCRECLRVLPPDTVQLFRKKDHFIFNVEGTGALPVQDVVREACRILMNKAANVFNDECSVNN